MATAALVVVALQALGAAGALASPAEPRSAASAGHAAPAVVCLSHACTTISNTAFPGLVIGSVERVLTPAEIAELFQRARARGAWPSLPADPASFSRQVRGVVLRTHARGDGPAREISFIALMTEDEYRDAGLDPGVFVRYAPHGPDHDAPPADQPGLLPYWDITGCVMALCRQGDSACEARYLPGIYERHTGVPLDWRSARPASAPPLIDPRTKLPVGPPAAAREPAS